MATIAIWKRTKIPAECTPERQSVVIRSPGGIGTPDNPYESPGALIGLGGLSLLFGVKPKVGADMITAFLLGVTPKMHDFWSETDPKEKMHNQVNFMKNAALLGGAALAAAVPEPWPVSLGNR